MIRNPFSFLFDRKPTFLAWQVELTTRCPLMCTMCARSSGQESLGFGRIEALFAGGRLESPAGTLEMPPHPASAAGPDLRQVVLGSEGRLGILTDAVLRARNSALS